MFDHTRITERYARGFTAAVVAAVTLILAANTGTARAAQPAPAQQTAQYAAESRAS